ncbi:NARE ribosyltransferase, partial [Nicator chloris]|nr:NARE ribosyltransferase [Nicator chloris]
WPLPAMALLARTLALLAMATVATVAIDVVPLDMARDSFDDQYRGCRPTRTVALPTLKYLDSLKNPHFARCWDQAEVEWLKRGSPLSPLSRDQAIAIMTYSRNDLYKDFNAAVRKAGRSRQHYQDNFHYKALHFLLTDALQTLRRAQNVRCRRVFRGVYGVWYKARRGDTVRFGQFTSTSLSKHIAQGFGTDTIFEVTTCHGADIRRFSTYPKEKEVLIPPYETFVVTQVTYVGRKPRIWLSSTGTSSKYNC